MNIILKYFPALTEKQITQISALHDLYEAWNQRINVISRKDMPNFYEHHVLHSLAIAARYNLPDGYHIMDLGSGGGFPGIPLAIYFPGVKFYLVDSISKKLKVAAEIAASIGLSNVYTEHRRAEEGNTRQYELVVSRAVAPLKDLWHWSKPLIKKSNEGTGEIHGLICLKGGDLDDEISQSNCRPRIHQIDTIFREEYFKQKYILFVIV